MNNENPTVLILDDDAIILLALEETLKVEGYRCLATTSPKEALEWVKKQLFSVILSDQRMAEMTGTEFFTKVKQLQPNAMRILITGVLTAQTLIEAINYSEVFRFLAKPWVREELLITVKAGHKRHAQLQANEAIKENLLTLNQNLNEENQRLRLLLKKQAVSPTP